MTNEEIKQECSRWILADRPMIHIKVCGNVLGKISNPYSEVTVTHYIIDDKHTKLRKLQIDKPDTKFECYHNMTKTWEYSAYPTWNIKLEYRVADELKAYNKPEFEYPIFKKSNANGLIVKFTELQKGEIVWQGSHSERIGSKHETWTEHTDTAMWEDVAYDKERDLFDRQPVYVWNSNDTSQRRIRFYDATNKAAFSANSKRNSLAFTNYKAVPRDRYDDWVLKAFKDLEK